MSLFSRSEVRECRRCGSVFTARGERDYYCSEQCRRQGSPKVTQVCHNCGREFELEQYLVERGQGKFCSQDCYHSQHPRVERICQICGNSFTVRAYYAAAGWGQFCSEQCQQRSYEEKRVTRVCQVCGKEFTVIPAVAKKKDGGKYCSKECSDAAKRDYVTLECEECGNPFSIPRSDLNRGRGKFCSRECFDKHVDAKVTLVCPRCGKEFVTHESQIRLRGRRFCSLVCSLLYRGETSIEALIREELERRGIPFEQQVKIGRFAVDFLLTQNQTVIECDGEYWHSSEKAKARDEYKDRFLAETGYQVFRFTEPEIRESPANCVDRVLNEA